MDLQTILSDFDKFLKSPRPLNKDWVDVRETMIVHTRGVIPDKLLKKKRPNEPEDLCKYRIENYRPVTKDKINHAIDAVIRILISSNYSIKYSDNISEYIQNTRFTLLQDELFEPLTLQQLIIEHLTRFIFDDPNGVLCWLPVNRYDDDIPPQLLQESERPDIQPILIDSPRVVHFTDDILVFECAEMYEIEVNYGNNIIKKESYKYYFIVTEEVIYRMLPYWDPAQRKIQYREELWYSMGLIDNDPNKNFPHIAAKVLGGNVTMNKKNQKYFESFFQSYAAFGDEAICAFSDNQAVRVRYNFPFVELKAEQCGECKGAKRIMKDGEKIVCPKCGGEGSVIPFNPFGAYYRKPPASGESEAFANSPGVTFSSPDVAILDSSFEAWQKFIEMANESVNIVKSKQPQSGTSKEYDREEKQDMLYKIINNILDIYKFSLDTIECYYINFDSDRALEDNIVKSPTSLTIKTEGDLYAELSDLMTKNAPAPFINTTAVTLSQKIYNGDRVIQKIIEILTIWDILFGRTDDQIGQLKATGAIQTEDIYKHINGYQILYKIAYQDWQGFEEADPIKVIDEANKQLALIVPRETPLYDTGANPAQETVQNP